MPSESSFRRPLMALAGVGWVLVVCIVLGYLAGSYLDRKWGTDPWLLVAGVTLGSAAGFVQLWRSVKQTLK